MLEIRCYASSDTSPERVPLTGLPVHDRVETAIKTSEPVPLSTAGLTTWPLGPDGAPLRGQQCGAVSYGIDNAGALSKLRIAGRDWASPNNTVGRFRYISHSEAEFLTFGDRYMLPGCRPAENDVLCGVGKPGLDKANATARDWPPTITAAWRSADGCRAIIAVAFAAEAQTKYGAPSVANISVTIRGTALSFDVQYHKRHTRMAESLWFSFAPVVRDVHGWRVDKLGISVDPFAVVVNGSRAMHAVWDGIAYHEPAPPSGHAMAGDAGTPKPVDSPNPVEFLRDEQIQGLAWHYNLFNDAWNTNYPLYEINTSERFRFTATFY